MAWTDDSCASDEEAFVQIFLGYKIQLNRWLFITDYHETPSDFYVPTRRVKHPELVLQIKV